MRIRGSPGEDATPRYAAGNRYHGYRKHRDCSRGQAKHEDCVTREAAVIITTRFPASS